MSAGGLQIAVTPPSHPGLHVETPEGAWQQSTHALSSCTSIHRLCVLPCVTCSAAEIENAQALLHMLHQQLLWQVTENEDSHVLPTGVVAGQPQTVWVSREAEPEGLPWQSAAEEEQQQWQQPSNTGAYSRQQQL